MPSIDATMLPDGAAQAAVDCKLGSGAIKPVHVALPVNTPSKSGTKSKIFLYDDAGTPYWFHWVGADVDVVKSPLPADSFKRVYWTGDGAPKMAPLAYAVTGGTGYPVSSYNLGLPAPAAPGVTRVGSPGADATLDESRAYVIRYVSAYGEVGPPSDASAMVTVSPGNSVTLELPTAPAGAYNVSVIDIFRTNTGTSGTEYQYVASVAVGTISYSDTKESADLGFVLDSTEYLAPPATLKGLIPTPFGSLAGFYDNVLCLSEPNQPHAWPATNQYTLADKIVAIGAFGNSILVTTTGFPYVLTGSTPSSMSVERFEEGYPCISKRGLVDMGYSILYPTPLGLMQIGVNGAKLVTQGACTIDEWKALKPETVHAYAYGGKYFAFNSDNDCFVFDPADGTYVQASTANLTGTVTAGHSDTASGKLYLQAGSDIVHFDGGVTFSTFTWKSKKFVAPWPLNMAALQVFAAGTVTAKVYADGVLKATVAVSSNVPVRLPGGFRATDWEVELSGSSNITLVLLATSMTELTQV